MGGVINSSAQIVPHRLSFEFASSANVALLYVVLHKAKLLEKTFFRKLIFAAKVFMGGIKI